MPLMHCPRTLPTPVLKHLEALLLQGSSCFS